MDQISSVLHFTKRFLSGTFLSRISGAIRDIVMALCFGPSAEVAAFMVAFRFANLFRRLLGEGSVQAGVIPAYASLCEEEGRHFFRETTLSFAAFLFCVFLPLEGVLWLLKFTLSEGWEEIIHLSMLMVPGIFFVCLWGVNASFLQAKSKYFLVSVSPVLLNLVWISFAFYLKGRSLIEAMRFLSIGIGFGFFVQWLMTTIALYPDLFVWRRVSLFSSTFKKLIKPIGLSMVGVGALQMNTALDAVFSRIADLSGPAYLWYAIRIQQLPLALFGVALSSALLPSLSRKIASGDIEGYRALLKNALRISFSLLLPCTFALFVLGKSGLNLLYGHGDFSSFDLRETLYALWGYAVGLVPSVFVLLMANGFYAKKAYKIPVLVSLFSICFHVLSNLLLVLGLNWGAFSIALNTSLASLINCLGLFYFISKEFHPFRGFRDLFFKVLFSSAVSSLCTLLISFSLEGEDTVGVLSKSINFVVLASVFALSFLALSLRLRVKEVFSLIRQ